MFEDFQYLEFLTENVEPAPIVDAMQLMLDDILNEKVKDFNFKTATDRFADLVYEYPFRVPPNFALIIRSLVTLEGVALSLSPDFRIIGVAYPYVARRLLTDESPQLRQRLLEVLFQNGKFRWQRLESLIDIARTDGNSLNLTSTARVAVGYLMSEEASDLRRQIVVALTEDDRLHVEEVQRLWARIQPELTPEQLLQAATASIPQELIEGPGVVDATLVRVAMDMGLSLLSWQSICLFRLLRPILSHFLRALQATAASLWIGWCFTWNLSFTLPGKPLRSA